MLIQNTDVIVTGREHESLNKYSCMLHELAPSEEFLWFGSFLLYVSEAITQRGKKVRVNCGFVFGWHCGFGEKVSLLLRLYTPRTPSAH